jgi:hypothetical protein
MDDRVLSPKGLLYPLIQELTVGGEIESLSVCLDQLGHRNEVSAHERFAVRTVENCLSIVEKGAHVCQV